MTGTLRQAPRLATGARGQSARTTTLLS